MLEAEFETPRLICKPLTKLAIAQHDSPAWQQRELRRDDIIRERAGAEQQFDAPCIHQLAENLPALLEISLETFCTVRFRGLLERTADFAADGDRAGEKVDRARLKGFRRRRTQKLARRDLKRFERHIHRLELRVARSHHRAERHETEVLIETQLPHRAGDDCQIVAALNAVLPEQGEQAGKNLSAP